MYNSRRDLAVKEKEDIKYRMTKQVNKSGNYNCIRCRKRSKHMGKCLEVDMFKIYDDGRQDMSSKLIRPFVEIYYLQREGHTDTGHIDLMLRTRGKLVGVPGKNYVTNVVQETKTEIRS